MKLKLSSLSLLALALFVAPAEAQIFGAGGSGGGGGGGDVVITSPLGPTTAPSAAVAVTDTGTPITGTVMPTGGQGLSGWLSALHNDLTGGSFTVTASPFAPNGNTSSLSVGGSSANVALPAGSGVLVTNTGAQTAFIKLGTSNSVVATALNLPVLSGQTIEVAPGSNTWIAAIETGGATTLRMSGGAGLFAGAGGGGSSGGGGSVTQGTSPWVDNITQWASVALGAPSNYGTSPGAVAVPGVNAFVTNTVAATVAQSTASNLNATVVGTGTFAVQLTGSTNNINNVSGTISLPTGAATSALQSNGNQKTQIVDSGGTSATLTGTALDVECANCSGGGGGVSTTDKAAFTSGSSLFAGSGGFFQTTATSNPLTTGQQGMFQVTANRALFTNLRNASGAELGVAAAPLQVDLANTAANATAIKVTGTGGTFPVTGTFFQATQPVSVASLPLPSGAATATNQHSTLAGTTDTSAQGIQGVTGGVEVPVVDQTVASTITSLAIPIPLPVDAGSYPPGGFTPNGNFATLAVTSATAHAPLPAGGGTSVAVTNMGTQTAFVNFGTSAVTAAITNNPIAAGQTIAYNVPTGATDLAAITVSPNTTNLIMAGGAGAYSGTGGAVTLTSPANDVKQGPTAFTGTGTITVNSQGSGSVGIQMTGSGAGLTAGFQGTVDGTNYVTIVCFTDDAAGTAATSSSANGLWRCPAAGLTNVRVNLTAISGGTETITLNSSAGSANQPVGTQGANINISSVGSHAVSGYDPCAYQAKTNVTISTASGTTALVAGVSAKKVYVCSLALIAPSAVSVSLSEGSGATCGTSNQAGVIGVGTNGTAANGMPLAANGGLTIGNGAGTIASTATAADYLCLFQSGTAQIAGNLVYVQQ